MTTGWKTFGHDVIVRALNDAHGLDRLAHAYLFTGPERTGRRTLALDLACLVNCEPPTDLFGDDRATDLATCPQAARIRNGQHADVRVIDLATPTRSDRPGDNGEGPQRQRISIEHVHDLQRDAALKPFEGKTRVFIIDGAETMSNDAANALLKTLEEPPDDVLIVLVASSSDALPETVVSRCQQFRLKPVPGEEIEARLVDDYGADPDNARLLARLSQGKPGWAIAALEDPALLEMHTQMMRRVISTVGGDLEQRFQYARQLSGSFRRDRANVLAELRRWAEFWRDVAVVKAGLTEQVINADWLGELKACAAIAGDAEVASAAQAARETSRAVSANANPRLAIEVMMLDMPWVGAIDSVETGAGRSAAGS